jgi:hypothetical protein
MQILLITASVSAFSHLLFTPTECMVSKVKGEGFCKQKYIFFFLFKKAEYIWARVGSKIQKQEDPPVNQLTLSYEAQLRIVNYLTTNRINIKQNYLMQNNAIKYL